MFTFLRISVIGILGCVAFLIVNVTNFPHVAVVGCTLILMILVALDEERHARLKRQEQVQLEIRDLLKQIAGGKPSPSDPHLSLSDLLRSRAARQEGGRHGA